MLARGLIGGALLAVAAAAAHPAAGTWEGTLNQGGRSLRIVFNVAEKGGKLGGTMDSPDQGARGIPLSAASAAGGSLTLGISQIKGDFTGKIGKDGKSATGRWRQGDGLPLTLKRTRSAGAAPGGDWEGTLNAGGKALRLVFHLTPGKGGWTGTLDSPDQRSNGIPLESVRVTGSSVRAEARTIGGEYTGTLSKDGKSLTGRWWQGVNVPLTLKRSR